MAAPTYDWHPGVIPQDGSCDPRCQDSVSLPGAPVGNTPECATPEGRWCINCCAQNGTCVADSYCQAPDDLYGLDCGDAGGRHPCLDCRGCNDGRSAHEQALATEAMIMDVTVPAGGCYVKVGTELKCDSPVDPQGSRACEYETSWFISSTEEANWSETETESEEVSVSETEGRSSSTTSQFGGSSYDTSTTTTHTRRFETTTQTGGSNTATGSSTDTAKTYLFGRSCQRQYLHITGFGFGDVDTEGTCAYSNM